MRSFMGRWLAGGVAAAMLSATAMAAEPGVTDDRILIGEIAPLTGAAAVGSLGLVAGNRLAVMEANANGGVNGRQLELLTRDDGYVPARTVQAARDLLNSEKVFALAATSGSASSDAILPMLRQMGVPSINVLSFPPSFFDPPVANIFVAGATHPDTTYQGMLQMNERFPDRAWAVILPDDTLGSLMGQGVTRAAEELGLNIAYRADYRRGQQDFSAEMLAASQAGAEIVFAGGIVIENIAMVRELERLGKDIPIVISWIGRNAPSDLQPMGQAVKNLYLIDYVVADETPEGQAFRELAEKYLPADQMAHFNRYTMVGYAGTRVLIDAMSRCEELTRECTVEQLEATNGFDPGIMAPMSFSPDDHFSRQDLSLMRANPETFAFEPVKEGKAD